MILKFFVYVTTL